MQSFPLSCTTIPRGVSSDFRPIGIRTRSSPVLSNRAGFEPTITTYLLLFIGIVKGDQYSSLNKCGSGKVFLGAGGVYQRQFIVEEPGADYRAFALLALPFLLVFFEF